MNPSPISTEAAALKARYGAILAPLPSCDGRGTRDAVAALDAARARLQGHERACAAQLVLDVTARP